jgi:hypothetical protein
MVKQHATGDEERARRKLGTRERKIDMIVFDHVITRRVAAEEVPEDRWEGVRGRADRATCDLVRTSDVGLPPERSDRTGQFQPMLAHSEPRV